MYSLRALFRIEASAFVRGLAVFAFVVGLGVWSALLFAPRPRALPPALDSSSPLRQDTAAAARWFGGGALRVQIVVMGLISDGNNGAALLAVNGATAQAYRIGQTLAPGVTLAAVSPTVVSINQDGVIEQVAMPVNPTTVPHGFIPVAKPSDVLDAAL